MLKVNHRRLLDAMFQACGVSADDFTAVCSSVDKLDKMSPAKVAEELINVKGQQASVVKRLLDLINDQGAAGDARSTLKW